MSKRAAFLSLALVLVAVSIQPGCGGNSGVTTPTAVPTPTPPPAPVTRNILEGSLSGLGVRVLGLIPFTTTATGTIEAHVDWTFPESTIYVYISRGMCTVEQVNAGQCQFLAVSETTTPKPRVVSVPNAPAGSYSLYVGNLGPKVESVSYQVLLTTLGGASVEGLPAPVEAQHAGEFVREIRPR